ncbi:MAG: Hsp20/alpha crystallin family protein [Thaumarchaeota archaeon]|nr:Hsp20/alpha crystallin family protein [Nitrososphaerota archaeon]
MRSRITKIRNKLVPSRQKTETSRSTIVNPEYSIDRTFEDMERSFSEFMSPTLAPLLSWGPLARAFDLPTMRQTMDLVDEGDRYVVAAQLPGFSKEDVDVRIDDQTLEVKAETKKEKESKDSNERAYSSFRRFIQFPEPVVSSKVEGTMKNGILSLRIPKKEPTSRRMMKVQIR